VGPQRAAVIAIALLALVLRLVIIAHSHGGQDLRMYTYFSRLALHGHDPFAPPHGGTFPGFDSNNPPVEVLVFAGLLWIHDSPTTLRVVFALVDVAVVLVIGLAFARSWQWRLGWIVFYAFNPFLLVAWTTFAEDKTLLFLVICAWMLALERHREWFQWLAASALTVFKFLGAFAVPALALDTFRRRRWWVLAPAALFLLAFALSNLPWFPHSLDAFSRRNQRLDLNPPIHASPMIILARLHLYAPVEAELLTVAAIVAVLAAFAARRIEIREALALSLVGGYAFLPDDAFNRLVLIALPVMLLLRFSLARWIAIWGASSVAALGAIVATRGVPHALSAIGGPLRAVFAHEGTARHALWMSLFPVVVLAFYVADRRTRSDRSVMAIASARSNAPIAAS
jgi:hypothetical protein